MASPVPTIVVLALGAGALGGADALRLLLAFAGQNPVVDIAICIVTMGMVTAQILGAVLLVRFVRKARAQAGAGGGAPAADHFAQMTLVVSVGVTVLVCACLLVVSGGLGSVCLLVDFAAKSPIVTVLATAATAAAFLPRTTPLLRIFREAANADGAAAPAAARATGRFAGTIRTVPLVAVCVLLVIRLVAPGGLDERSLFPGLPWPSPSINWPVGVAIAGGGAATDAGRFAKLTEMPYAPPGRESDGGKHACSA